MTRASFRRALSVVHGHPGDLVRALVLLPITALKLRRSGYWRTLQWLDERRPPVSADRGPVDTEAVERAERCGQLVRLAAIAIPDATCLRKSLVHRELLKRAGVPASIRFGALPAADDGAGAMLFHAWVEVDGQVVSEPPAAVAGFVPLDGSDQPWFPL